MGNLQKRVRGGFSMIEVMIYVFVSVLLIGLASGSVGLIGKKATAYLKQVNFQEEQFIFLHRFEREKNLFIHNTDNSSDAIQRLQLKIDRNNDGDYGDSWEDIGYVFDDVVKKLKIRTDGSPPTRIVDFVENFEWKQSGYANCREMIWKSSFSENQSTILFCKY